MNEWTIERVNVEVKVIRHTFTIIYYLCSILFCNVNLMVYVYMCP